MPLPYKLQTAQSDDAYADEGRHEFVVIMCEQAEQHGIVLSRWERDFLESNYAKRTFTPKQREVIDRIFEKYPHMY